MFRPSPYEELQTLFGEGRELSDKERLLFASGPLLSWYRENKRDLPWRENKDPYRIWVSEIMLQQTRVEAVKPYFFRFMDHFPDVKRLAGAPEEELLKCWEGLGYYSRARNLKKAAEIIVSEYGGNFPNTFDEILSLPGIGNYTAGAIASIAFEIPVPAVDGNVLRVLSRVTASRDDILKQSTKKKMEELVRGALKSGSAGDFNQALIETGAVVCIPNGEPLCDACPFYTVCESRKKGLTGEIPVKASKRKRKTEEITVLLLEYEDKIAIRKREEDGLLASLYEFYNVPGKLDACEIQEKCGKIRFLEKLPEAKHIFSHVEWHMSGFFVSIENPEEAWKQDGNDGLIFAEWEEIREKYPIPNAFAAYKKYLDQRYGGNET